jgi:hypothetical protein
MTEVINIKEIDLTKRTSEINREVAGGPTDVKGTVCWLSGIAYAPGTRICMGGGPGIAGRIMICTPSGGWAVGGPCYGT